MLKIIQSPDPVLFQEAKPIKKIDAKLHKLIEEMEKSLLSAKDPEGVGLAAPQIGKSLKIYITKPNPDSEIKAYINPKLTNLKFPKKKKSEESRLEGCLSIRDVWGVVDRANSLTITYMDINGLIVKENLTGFPAVIAQHEVDHLDGKLFTSRVLEQKNKLYNSHKNKKGETEFTEIEV